MRTTVSIKLPYSNGESGQKMSDMLLNKSLEEMKSLVAEAEANGTNTYARRLCNEALKRQGNNPCF